MGGNAVHDGIFKSNFTAGGGERTIAPLLAKKLSAMSF